MLNRGRSDLRPVPAGVETLIGDARQPEQLAAVLGRREFDVVGQFVGFTPGHVSADVDFFAGRCGQYLYISSASAYQTPVRWLPISESTPLFNPVWKYSQDKLAAEAVLTQAWAERGFPATIIRPGHTYDCTSMPMDGGWAGFQRLLAGREVVVHGDGSSLWTLTHSHDFAKAFVGLMGPQAALGDVFGITSDEYLSWDQITETVAAAAGVQAKIVHVTSEAIAAADPDFGDGLLGDKTYSAVFDNTKVKRLVPWFVCTTSFADGMAQAFLSSRAPARIPGVERDALTSDRIRSRIQNNRSSPTCASVQVKVGISGGRVKEFAQSQRKAEK